MHRILFMHEILLLFITPTKHFFQTFSPAALNLMPLLLLEHGRPPRCWRPWSVLLDVELRGVSWDPQLLAHVSGAVLQRPVGPDLEERLRPDLPVLHIHSASRSENTHTHALWYLYSD